ncbi:MAG: molecular chaperone HtpG, partial [Bacteroidales bacterium]|nr:molecular chaperone HtpG [Bacteroidales bacterium]
FLVSFENLGENESPVLITQSEFTRRMKEMSELGGGPNFYGGMPDSYSLVVNASHPLVNKVMESKEKALGKKLQDMKEKLEPLEVERTKLEKDKEGKKEEEITQEQKDKLEETQKKISQVEDKKKSLLTEYGGKNKIVKQMIDLALLSNNMLKGEELVKFVKRSVDLIK